MRLVFPICLGLYLWAAGGSIAQATPLDTTLIEQITSRPGVFDTNENVFKIRIPREEFPVFVDGQPLAPFRGLNSWVAFTTAMNGNDMVMGDIALFQDEVNPALDAALNNGFSVTALNGRFLFAEPEVYFMHISGQGDLKELALGVSKILSAIRHIRTADPNLPVSFGGLPPPGGNDISGQTIEKILGVNGRARNGMFKVTIGCTTSWFGMNLGPDMGVDTVAAFAGVDDNATVNGDLAVPQDDLQNVLKALRKGGIYITAINNQMTDETPRIMFVGYWGQGDIRDLAKTLKAALDTEDK